MRTLKQALLFMVGIVFCAGSWVYCTTPLGKTTDQDVDSLLASLSNQEKIGQMVLVYHSPYAFLKQYHIGGVLIMANMLKDPDALAVELDSIQQKMRIGLLVAIDQEGGKVNRLASIPQWKQLPGAKQMAQMPLDSITALIDRVAKQLKALHINVNLAPVLDPTHNGKGKETFMSVRERSLGRTADQIVGPACAFVKGFSQNQILCIAKHFPGYDVATNSDHHIAVSQADSQTVAAYTQAFARVNGNVAGVLMSSIHYSTFCKMPSVFSPKMVQWARNLDPQKLIMTDDLWGAALRAYVTPNRKIDWIHYPDPDFKRLAEMAFKAGNDILMITFPKKVELIQQAILELIQKDPQAQERLDQSVRRILVVKKRLGLVQAKKIRGQRSDVRSQSRIPLVGDSGKSP